VRLVNSCHINIAHNNVECSMQAYNGTFAKSVWSVTRPLTLRPPPPPWSESLDKPLYQVVTVVTVVTHNARLSIFWMQFQAQYCQLLLNGVRSIYCSHNFKY